MLSVKFMTAHLLDFMLARVVDELNRSMASCCSSFRVAPMGAALGDPSLL